MKLGLIQTTHSPMCNFLSREFPFSPGECAAMQERQVQQNLSLLSAASGKGYDLLVTTECINYIRLGPDTPTDISLYPELDCSHVEALSHSTREAESYLVAGFGYREGSQAYNAALVFDRRGNLLHHKIHLAGDENRIFTPGQDFCVVEGDFGTFGCVSAGICSFLRPPAPWPLAAPPWWFVPPGAGKRTCTGRREPMKTGFLPLPPWLSPPGASSSPPGPPAA